MKCEDFEARNIFAWDKFHAVIRSGLVVVRTQTPDAVWLTRQDAIRLRDWLTAYLNGVDA
jgi:hypothetical protein